MIPLVWRRLSFAAASLATTLTLAQTPPGPPNPPASAAGARSALEEAGEPRAQTSSEPRSQTSEPTKTAPAESSKATAAAPTKPGAGTPEGAARRATRPGGPTPADRLDLGTATVTGDREQPKVMYVVPWKRADIGDLSTRPMNSLLDEALAPVDRDEFRREVQYYRAVNGEAAQQSGARAAVEGEK